MAIPKFKNEPLTDFSIKSNRIKMEQALAKVASELGKEYDLVINGQHEKRNEKLTSYNPSNKTQVVGIFQKGSKEDAIKAIEAAQAAFHKWKFVPGTKRADYLFKAARIMRKRKFELGAVMVYEVGKTWPEADGDVAEAIDFLEFYGREMVRLSGPQPLVKNPGEKNVLEYIPLGVGAVIPPWNFPLAILAGMTSAAFVAGNTVLLKPASDSPTIAAKFVEILEEVKLPAGVVNFLTGPGGSIGDTIIEHPKIRFVAFTGSKEVGLRINQKAATQQSGQIWIKRTILEMGGKDSIIVDREADIDSAVTGVVASAFGYQGQKCSACSRAIVDEAIYDNFVEKLVKKTESLKVGDPVHPDISLGPVINEGSQQKILDYIRKGIQEGGRLVAGGEKAQGNGYFIKPTVIADVAPNATIAQEEIFGPVLAVIKARDYDEALRIGNNTEYGLTGAVYSKNKKKLQRAYHEFHVGNLYFNRKCTGAMVGVHPFGGFNMSGTDSKAGGKDYLLLYTQAKSIAEKIGK